jgi:hypothetical protein
LWKAAGTPQRSRRFERSVWIRRGREVGGGGEGGGCGGGGGGGEKEVVVVAVEEEEEDVAVVDISGSNRK